MFDIKNLNDTYFSELNVTDIPEIKELSVEDKVKCFKYFLNTDYITNKAVITNLYLFIDGISGISDELTEDNRIFFTSLSEYVDIKLELKDDIKEFCFKLLKYYFSMLKGLDVKLDELKEHIPNTYYNFLMLVNPTLISKIMNKYSFDINTKELKPAHNSDIIYNSIHNSSSLIAGFITNILRG